jgi:hypothetical protein
MRRVLHIVILALAGMVSTGARALPIYVDQTAVFRYVNATAATSVGAVAANWYAPGFDDSAWFSGPAPFSSGPTSGTIGNTANAGAPFAPDPVQPIPSTFTPWSVHFDPYLRTTFTLAAPTALTVWIAVDNGINSMYINGVLATAAVNAEGAAFRWEHVFDIPVTHTFAGVNTFALQLEDHGVATGFVMMITGDAAGTQLPFTTNPPPPPQDGVPAPAALLLLGAGLLGLGLLGPGALRRRRAV